MKKILVLNFFPAFTPPSSGGELRYYHIYKKLSNYFDITLLSPSYNDKDIELIEHSNVFREYRIPKEDIHNEIHWKLEQENFSPEFSALTCAYSADKLNEYHKYYLKLYPAADIIIHESPFMLNYDLFFAQDNKPRIYNSYNVEYDLLKQIYHNKKAKRHLKFIFNLEKRLIQNSQIIFAISQAEKIKFHKLYNIKLSKIQLAPNGINPEDFSKRDKKIKRKTAFFIGSWHLPNIQAIEFIIEKVAKSCPDITFLIAGSCCGKKTTTLKNLKLLGKVKEKEKDTLFKTSDVAINPMFSGAGTNLKTLEFLSMGIPMISTEIGVRGIDINDGEHFVLANKSNFSEKLKTLINDEKRKRKISKYSKLYINKNFAWKHISQNIYHKINNLKKKKKKTLLLLNDFEVSNPFGGGEIRINRLYSELSKSYNIVLLCLNNTNNIKKTNITNTFLEISFPKTKEHKKEEQHINLQYYVSATDIVNSYMVSKNELFMSTAKNLAETFDITVLCHPYMYEAIKDISPNYLIHESLNHELSLKKSLLSKHPHCEKLINQTLKIEEKSCQKSNLILSVSDTDHSGLRAYVKDNNKEIVTIKNGVDIVTHSMFNKKFTSIKNMFNSHTVVMFIGSAHMPNIDALKYIITNLALQSKDCYFIIIGSVCDAVSFDKIPSNVILFGKLELDYKNVLCSIADIAINPMFGGSGSNLKLAEYFSWKLPVISTTFGARGYDITNDKEAIICDIKDFAKNIKRLQNNTEFAKKLSSSGFEYVKSNTQWSVLAKKYSNLLDKKVYGIVRKKLLIVTYRFTLPPLGGAEVYMLELLKGLDKLDNFDITLAYLDSYDIQNKYHFSIDATHNTTLLEHDFKNITFVKCTYDELNDRKKQENSKVLMQNWTNEFLLSARKYTNLYTSSLLMGGWNFPEKGDKSFQIWSSSISEIYLKNTKELIIKGFSHSRKELILKLENEKLHNVIVKGSFVLKLSIPKNGILQLHVKTEDLHRDIRPLGVLIHSIICDKKALELSFGYRDFLKQTHLSSYIDELISTATSRDKKIDDIFQETRGLNSQELETYLDKHIQLFDVILGHSIPFATTPITAKYATKYEKPFALLPHVHFDDEFYHWQSYYKAMQKADCVFASPALSIVNFYDKLNIKTVEVPGGGVNKAEYENIDSEPFLQLYKSQKPYFFVLGRKSGAKNYASIVEAVEKLNKKEHICNLVMIGRDEDKVKINSKYTKYLGEQSREVVLGALKNSLALINMSESESFGIVIVEAWMLKKPVIVNEKCPAFTELVQNDVNGLHATSLNLIQKIKILVNNNTLTASLGSSGCNNTVNYIWSEIIKKFNKKLLEI